MNEHGLLPFDIALHPLWRLQILRLENTENILCLTIDHLICDGWSIKVFCQELTTFYEAFSSGKPSPLTELPIQYVDFAVWQRNYLQGQVLESQLNYWKQQLSGEQQLLKLPTTRPRPAIQTYSGARQPLTLTAELTQALTNISQREKVTLFITLLAAFQTLLYRYTGQEDIIVGSPIAARNHIETEGLIGFFVNTLPLFTNLAGNPSFQELLARVKSVVLDAYTHQDVPFEKIVEELRQERDTSRSPIFQVMFAFENSEATLELPEVTITPLKVHSGAAKFDITLSMRQTLQGLTGFFEYNTDLFDAGTISRMVEHFQILLNGIIINHYQAISELPLLTQAEQHQLLFEWNYTQTNYPQNICIHQLFEQQVKQTPSALAIVFGQQITYQQLNTKANQLARHLQKLGVEPEVLVGVCVERSIEMVVGFLAILKAGGAYVPLPAYPKERLALMLASSELSVLLTQKHLVEKLPSHSSKLICIDADWQIINTESEENLNNCAKAQNLAYVIYTSGSTGKPKGVAVTHQAVIRLLFNTNYVELKSSDKIAQVANACFDAATFEIWGALLHGGQLIIITEDVLLSPQKFAESIHAREISVLFLTTALFNQLVSIVPQAFHNLRYLLFGGEAVEPLSVRTLLAQSPPQKLLHVYGPTEATTFSSWYLVQKVPLDNVIPIGRPISNTQIYILDTHQSLVPIGVVGEVYIGGDGLARGYINRPELTAEKFIPNPFSKLGVLYKTGDLARYLPDGNIEFIGRIDNQVKIRGFRVELTEIEKVIAQHKSVKETAVIALDDATGNKTLVAYVVSNQQRTINYDELRYEIKQKLPEYMAPNVFVTLDALPLTPNGKIDRRLLPAVTYTKPEQVYCSPQNQLEHDILDIWENILGIHPISTDDNFFELGGHSLLAVRLIAEIEQQLGKRLSITTLFQTPTVKQLANALSQEKSVSSIIEITPLNRDVPPLFWCTPHLNYNLNLLAKYIGAEQPLFGLDSGYFKIENPDTHIRDYAARYVEEIRAIQPNGPYKLGGYCMGGILAFEIAQQLRAQGEQCDMLALVERSGLNRIHRYCTNISIAIDGHRNNLAQLNHTQQLIYTTKLINKIFIRSLFKFRKNLNQQEYSLNNNSINTTLIQQRAIASVKKYSSQKPYPGNIILIFAENNNYNYLSLFFPKYGWSKAVTGKIDISLVTGNHVSVTEEPHIQEVAAKLNSYLINFRKL